MTDRINKTEAQWRAELGEEQFYVCRQKGTERPFTGKYHACHTVGTYACSCCGAPLFDSATKFDSGSGWPSFFQALEPEAIAETPDHSHGMQRVEVSCRRCGAHLGHVFADGPAPSGLRYCINSIALNLRETDET